MSLDVLQLNEQCIDEGLAGALVLSTEYTPRDVML